MKLSVEQQHPILKEYNIYVSEKSQVQLVQVNSYNYKVLIHNQFKK